MKKSLSLLVVVSLLSNSYAQTAKLNTLKNIKSLAWYKNFLTNKLQASTSTSGETILNQRTVGALKVQVGANLVPGTSQYSNSGTQRTEQSDGITCKVQPKTINFLLPGDFSIMRQASSFANYPGDFVNPNTIINSSGSLSPYNTMNLRNPYKIGISIFSNNGTKEITVADFNTSPQAKIQDSLLRSNYGATIPANGILEITEIKSEVQLKASLEYSYGVFLPLEELGVPADITAGIKMEGNSQRDVSLHYFMVSFTQPLYTLNLLTNTNGLFANPVHLSSNSTGAYISDVTYGRKAFFIFAAATYQDVMNAMFDGGLDATVTGGEAAGGEVGVKGEGTINNSIKASIQKFWGVIYGGNSTQALSTYNDISSFHAEFKNYINSTSAKIFRNTTGALPLSYSLRRISDGAIIAVRSTGSFDEKVECNTNSYTVDLNFESFTVNRVVEAPFDNEDDIFGNLKYSNRNTNAAVNKENGDKFLFNKAYESAISKKQGETYDGGDNPVRIINSISRGDLLSTILKFSEDIRDWEILGQNLSPRYNPLDQAEMQFSFEGKTNDIDALAPGQSKTYYRNMELYEDGNSDKAKVTFKVKIVVKRN